LYNHECFLTGDIDYTADLLTGYDVSYNDVLAVYSEELAKDETVNKI